MEKEKVQILMSTYNGERFLREQIDSLLKQTYQNIEILIRDDGSKDRTPEILKEYQQNYPNIQVYLEENTGVNESFFELLRKSDADYVAFCDQDDVWLEEKVQKAVEKLQGIREPALYCSNKILVDSNLKVIMENNHRKLRPGFENAVVECICTGCTSMMNRSLAEKIKAHIPEHAIIHDWWCYLAASYLGQVIYDDNAYIWYRQHGGNVIGASNGFFSEVKAKAAYLKKNKGKLQKQLQEFSQIFSEKPEKDRLIRDMLDTVKISGRFRMVFSKRIYRQSFIDECVTRGLILCNRLL